MNNLIPYNELIPLTELDFDIDDSLRKLAEETRVAIEVLNYAVRKLPKPQILLDSLSLQEAKMSSNIENIVTTNDDLYKGIILDEFTFEAKEVLNYKTALYKGFDKFLEQGFISIEDMETINSHVNIGQPGIRTNLSNFENTQTRIALKKINGEIEILYTPPHGKDLLQKLLIDMLDYIYNDDEYRVHPLIKIAIAHYQFESIHPFFDGNGRTGRILNILFLCEKGYLAYPILYASSYIIKNKNEYYSLLQTCKENGEYQKIIEYMLTSFLVTAKRTLEIVENIKAMIDKYSSDDFINKLKGQKQVLEKMLSLIFEKVYVRIEDLVEEGIHRQTASVYLKQLVDLGLLTEEKIGKVKIFKNIKLLELFEGESV